MDKLLNLLSAIRDDNYSYDTEVYPILDERWSFGVSCKKFIDGEDGSTKFEFDKLVEALKDFEEYSMQSYVQDEGPLFVETEDVHRHTVEILVND